MLDYRQTFQKFKQEKFVRTCGMFIILLSIFIAVYFSAFAALIILTNYVLGFVICWGLLKYEKQTSLYLQRLAGFYHTKHTEVKDSSKCRICNKISCLRHGNKKTAPWKNLIVDKHLNNTLEEFYNSILQAFVSSWYGNFTSDPTFTNELRYCLRFVTASIVKRALELDTGKLIATKLAPCIIKHVDDYIYMKQISTLKNTDINKIAVEYLGSRMHIAVSSRKNELSYLQNLVTCLLPQLLPDDYLKCRNYNVLIREIMAVWVFLPLMDVLSDPNIINSLVILISTYKSKADRATKKDDGVELLVNFNNKITKPSTFACELKTIKNDTSLLYAFMQFLKKENNVHILQFCLDVDEFNVKLLTPDLSRTQLENLHKEATKLFKEYFEATSPNFLNCSPNIISSFHQLLEEGVYNVAKLRTSEPLYQAYEFALNTLENDLLPLFFHSNEFYMHICGDKITPTFNKAAVNKSPMHSVGSPLKIRGRKYYEPVGHSAVSKISSSFGKIKGALRSNQPIEGAVYSNDPQDFENGAIEDIIINDCSNIFRDLRTWQVSIPNADINQLGSKTIVTYYINVQRLDAISETEKKQWIVERRDQDFYTLRVKLIEFHGESVISNCPFPTRRTSMVLDTRRKQYEEFLNRLLQKTSLRGSDLLHAFLTCEEDFTMFVTASETAVGDLGNIYQSVAYMLRKEKGQYLDSFMSTYLASTLKTKQGKPEWAEIGDECVSLVEQENQKIIPKIFVNSVFKDNFGVSYDAMKTTASSPFTPNNLTESVFYLLRHVFKVPIGILRMYAAVCSIGQPVVESSFQLYLEYKIRTALCSSNLSYLLGLLKDVIFTSRVLPTENDLEARRTRMFNELNNSLSSYFIRFLGDDFKQGFLTTMEMLQNPVLNKQLMYNLMDIIISEMFSQLKISDKN